MLFSAELGFPSPFILRLSLWDVAHFWQWKNFCAVQLLAMKKANFSTDKIDKNEHTLDYRYCNLQVLQNFQAHDSLFSQTS